MDMFIWGAVFGAAIASGAWWIAHRSVAGVKSDLTDVKNVVVNIERKLTGR